MPLEMHAEVGSQRPLRRRDIIERQVPVFVL
jgi:hypothetical protein